MKLKYWVADREDDSRGYSIRRKTRREVLQALREVGAKGETRAGVFITSYGARYSVPRQVITFYKDGFDLAQKCFEGRVE